MQYETSDTAFVVENVDEVLSSIKPQEKKYVQLTPGIYNCVVKEVSPNKHYDKTDRVGGEKHGDPLPNAIVRRAIPLEVIEGEFAGEWIWLSVYMQPTDPNNQTHKTKFRMGQENMAMLAKACGISKVDNLNDCCDKFIKVTMVERNGWLNIKDIEPYSAIAPKESKPEPKVSATSSAKEEAEVNIEDDIPF